QILESNLQFAAEIRRKIEAYRGEHVSMRRNHRAGKKVDLVSTPAPGGSATKVRKDTIYAIKPVSEQEKPRVSSILQEFAWDAEIDGRYDPCTGQFVIRFDGGEPLSDEAEARLSDRLGKVVRPVHTDQTFSSGCWFAIQAGLEQE